MFGLVRYFQQRTILVIQRHNEISLLLMSLTISFMVIYRCRKVKLTNSAVCYFLGTTIDDNRYTYTQDIKNYKIVILISYAIENNSTKITLTVMTLLSHRV